LPRRLRTIVTQVGSFLLAGALLYLALRGVDFAEVIQALRRADYVWLLPLAGIVLLSHWLRAWRWQMMLDALPAVGRRIPVSEAFAALMIGYMVNYAAPRLGEVVRSANLSTRQHVPFSGIFGTVVVERILDAATLALGLASVVYLMRHRMADLHRVFVAPIAAEWSLLPVLLVAVMVIVLFVLLFAIARRYVRRSKRATTLWRGRIRPIAVSFRDGVLTLFRSRRRVGLVSSTMLIWLCYAVMAHLPFVMLGMTEVYGLSIVDAWSIMLLGALGFVVPSPGGVGSYHYITVLVLVSFFSVDRAPAATYAVFTHAAQLVLYVIVGFICIIVQGATLRSIKAQAASVESGRTEE